MWLLLKTLFPNGRGPCHQPRAVFRGHRSPAYHSDMVASDRYVREAQDTEMLLKRYLRPGRDRGSPNQGSTVASKRVMAQIRSPVRVRT